LGALFLGRRHARLEIAIERADQRRRGPIVKFLKAIDGGFRGQIGVIVAVILL